VLIAQTVFLLERGQTDKQTDATERHTHAGGYAGVGNKKVLSWRRNAGSDVDGRPFHALAAAAVAGNTRSTSVEGRDDETTIESVNTLALEV